MGPKRAGRKISYVTDTMYLPSIAKEVQGSDLLFCEGMFDKAFEDQAAEKKHMTSTQAAQIAKDANVDKMALIHYSPRYTDFELKVLLDEAQKVFPNTILSKDRMSFEIPNKD
jgi:ribonuclease Z